MANIGLHSLLSPFTTEVIEFCAMILIEQDFIGNFQHVLWMELYVSPVKLRFS